MSGEGVMAESDRLVAMAANIAIAVSKFAAVLLTGRPSMLTETYHSVSDTGNQVLLLIGMFYSRRGRTNSTRSATERRTSSMRFSFPCSCSESREGRASNTGSTRSDTPRRSPRAT